MNQEVGPAVAAVAPDDTNEEGGFAEDEEGGGREGEVVDLAERRARIEETARLQQRLTKLLVEGVVPAAEKEN